MSCPHTFYLLQDPNCSRAAAVLLSLQRRNEQLRVSVASANKQQRLAAEAGKDAAQHIAASVSSLQSRCACWGLAAGCKLQQCPPPPCSGLLLHPELTMTRHLVHRLLDEHGQLERAQAEQDHLQQRLQEVSEQASSDLALQQAKLVAAECALDEERKAHGDATARCVHSLSQLRWRPYWWTALMASADSANTSLHACDMQAGA